VVGGGITTFYFNEAHSGFVADVNAFWTALQAKMPTGVAITTENTGDLIDIETGAITGSWTDGSTATMAANGTGSYAGGVGARIRWATSGISNKRRVRGSTFIVPLTVSQYDTDGTLTASMVTTLGTAAGSLFTAAEGNMRIYTRPVLGVGGKASTVLNYTTPDRVSWLRTRRT